MAKKMYYYNVKNRSAGAVLYKIPEDNIVRRFAPGETKRLSYEELLHLSFQTGGRELMAEYLQIESADVPATLGIQAQPEYYMSEKDVIDLLQTGSIDAFLDCLDFAPTGVIELIKQFAVKLPLADFQKRQALKNKLGFDVDAAVANSGLETDEKKEEAEKTAMAGDGTRRTKPNYRVVSKG